MKYSFTKLWSEQDSKKRELKYTTEDKKCWE